MVIGRKTWDCFSYLPDENTDDYYIIKVGRGCHGSNVYKLIYEESAWSVK